MEAETIRCPSCGAPSRDRSPACKHCGSTLATVACPKCLNLMFRDDKYCNTCGASAVHWLSKQGNLACPECEQPMLEGMVGECQVHHCGVCHGIWLDRDTFAKVCQNAEDQAAILGTSKQLGPQDPLAAPRIKYRPCPRCTERMNRMNFARCSGVVVDICGNHGTWFDHQELQHIVRFIRSGGLQRSREAELRHLQEERRNAERTRHVYDSSPQPAPVVSDDLQDLILWGAVRAAGWLIKEMFRR